MSLKKLIVSTVAAAALATGAMAAGNAATDIAVSMEKKGDYLLFSNWYAVESADWKTDLRIVNTDTMNSTIAKFVIRDGAESNELLDFIIYLTPGDVWSGTVYAKDGALFVHSTDDSMIFNNVTAAEKDGGYTLKAYRKTERDDMTRGYIEVFGAAQPGEALRKILGNAPVDKHDLYKAFATDAGYNLLDWKEADNDLIGQAVIYSDSETAPLAMTYTATAFENVTGIGSGALGGTPLNDPTDPTGSIVGADTRLSAMTTYAVCDAINAMEDTLDKVESYAVHYGEGSDMDESRFTATFSTKKYRFTEGGKVCPISEKWTSTGKLAAATFGTEWFVTYSQTPRDMEENTIVPENPDEISGDQVDKIPPKACETELCEIAIENAVKGGSGEGYVTYTFFGRDNMNPMPYDHKILSAKKVGGKDVTNIISPSFLAPTVNAVK
jgi:hypothetical protein